MHMLYNSLWRSRPPWLAETKLTLGGGAGNGDEASIGRALPLAGGIGHGSNGSIGGLPHGVVGDESDDDSQFGGRGHHGRETSTSNASLHGSGGAAGGSGSLDFDAKRSGGNVGNGNTLGLVPADGTSLSAAVAARRLAGAGRNQPSQERSPLLRPSSAGNTSYHINHTASHMFQ
jgi:hypothetical protein